MMFQEEGTENSKTLWQKAAGVVQETERGPVQSGRDGLQGWRSGHHLDLHEALMQRMLF